MKTLKNILTIILILTSVFFILKKVDLFPSFTNLFTSQAVIIDNTPILVKDIKSIGELITYSSTDELVADSTLLTQASITTGIFNKVLPFPVLPTGEKKLVLICKGKIYAGTKLSGITNADVDIHGDTIKIILPKAEILDAIINPTDIETFIEKGVWSSQEISAVKIKARRKMIERAINKQILEKADSKTIKVMESYLKSLGYSVVIVSIK